MGPQLKLEPKIKPLNKVPRIFCLNPWSTQHLNFYSEYHEFRLTKWDYLLNLFLTTFEAFIFFEATGAVAKIGSSLKPNHHYQV